MRFVIAGLALLVGAAPGQEKKGLEIRWVDVEGGAATLIVTPAGESILVDCGWPGKRDAERIKSAAEAAGASRIDHYVTSHWHTDHWGGVAALSEILKIGAFYDHGFPDGAKDVDPKLKEAYLAASGGKNVVLKPGDALPLKDTSVSVKVLAAHGIVLGEAAGAPQVRKCEANPEHPPKPEDTSDNARSLGLLVTFGGFKFVDMGDLTWNVEHKLVCPANLIGTADVYQVTHHGLDISNHPALLKAVSPTVAVVNNGAKKGGSPVVYGWLKGLPGLKDVFQVHRNVQAGPDGNAPAAFVANDEAECKGEGIRLSVAAGGKSYAVEVPAKKTRREYAVK